MVLAVISAETVEQQKEDLSPSEQFYGGYGFGRGIGFGGYGHRGFGGYGLGYGRRGFYGGYRPYGFYG